jgi:hypothetical protein
MSVDKEQLKKHGDIYGKKLDEADPTQKWNVYYTGVVEKDVVKPTAKDNSKVTGED